MNYNKKCNGFSLIELMAVLAIFSIVMTAVYGIMNSGRKSWNIGDVRIELQEDVRRAMDAIIYELSESSSAVITISGGGSIITFQVPVDDSSAGSWEDTNSDGNPDFYLANTLNGVFTAQWGAYLNSENRAIPSGLRAGRSVRFLLSGTQLRRQVLDSFGAVIEDVLVAQNLNTINFAWGTGSSDVIITVTGNKLTKEQQSLTYTLSSAVYFR